MRVKSRPETKADDGSAGECAGADTSPDGDSGSSCSDGEKDEDAHAQIIEGLGDSKDDDCVHCFSVDVTSLGVKASNASKLDRRLRVRPARR